MLLLAVPAAVAQADPFQISYSGTVTSVSLDLATQISVGDTISGTLELDDSIVGVFTPTPNPTFIRSEMLYSGAVTSASLSVNGHTVTGSGGDIELFDALEESAGSDFYEGTATLDTGTVGGVVPERLVFVPEYLYTTFTVSDGDPLFPPPSFDPGKFNFFSFRSAAGGSASGRFDSFEVVSAPPVPSVSPTGSVAIALILATVGVAYARSSRLSPAG